jgi:hypothetical protein
MAKKEEDLKKKEKIAVEQYFKEQVKTAKKAIGKDVITGTKFFLNCIEAIEHKYISITTSIVFANSIVNVIQANKKLLNNSQEDLTIISEINYNIAEALVVYLKWNKSKYDEIVKSAINYYFRSGTHDALKKIIYLDQDKTLVSAKAHYQIGNIHFNHIKIQDDADFDFVRALEHYKKAFEITPDFIDAYIQTSLLFENPKGSVYRYKATKYFPKLKKVLAEGLGDLPKVLENVIFEYLTGEGTTALLEKSEALVELVGEESSI